MTATAKPDILSRSCSKFGGKCPLAVLVNTVRPGALNCDHVTLAGDADLCSHVCLQSQGEMQCEWDRPASAASAGVNQVPLPQDAGLRLREDRWAAYDYKAVGGFAADQAPTTGPAVRHGDGTDPSEGRRALTIPEQPSTTSLLYKEVRAVLFADVADSVRMIHHAEDRVVRRWVEAFNTVYQDIAPRHSGRLVKSSGDGFVLDFMSPTKAIECALAIQEFLRRFNDGAAPGEAIELRIGMDVGEIYIGDLDIYGHRVNVAARIMSSLARPGQIVLTSEARDSLDNGLDADFEDLGERVVKGVETPVRAFLAWPPGFRPALRSASMLSKMLPAIAIIPFSARMSAPQHAVLGDILADGVIHILSRSLNLDVISRLSTTSFRERSSTLAEIGRHLKTTYVLSGSYVTDGADLRLSVELSEVRTAHVIWSDRFSEKISGILSDDSEMLHRLVRGAYEAVAATELRRVRLNTLASVESYSLLLAAIVLMHRRSARDFMSAREMLETISEREPRHPLPKAWLANWYVLRIQQGLSTDFALDRSEAVRCTSAALDVDPENSLALATAGLVHTHMTKRHDLAAESYRLATESNPNDALAWLLQGTHKAFTGEGEAAVKDTQRAMRLSPMDPQSYYFNSLSASALLANGENALALQHADEALRSNKLHTSSLRAKAVAQWRLGLHEEAVATGVKLLQHEPGFTVSSWLKRSPMSEYAIGRELADTLRSLGMPA